ncbi:MAG: hypothetical protein HRU19_30125 [Pseudobacteriovorax sp.]|nr:hypothetical protein [Pseudobacteriovorax sp.]
MTIQQRMASFIENRVFGDWQIKLYTISNETQITQTSIFNDCLLRIPEWLTYKNGFNDNHHNHGFFILHETPKGVFAVIAWWVEENILTSHVFFYQPNQPATIKKISGEGIVACSWELAIIAYESRSWSQLVVEEGGRYNKYANDHFPPGPFSAT